MGSASETPQARLRAILAGERCLHPATVFDPVSVRIAVDLGFEAGMLAGSVAATSFLGMLDRILLTLTELAGICRRCAAAGDLPIVVDGDHGYGNALNVMRMIEELELAGIAGVSIEDTVLPQPFGRPTAPAFISIEEGVGKMRAALAARRPGGIVVIGRTAAAASAGVDEAIARARAYEEAGVDALFFTGLKAAEQVDALSAGTRLPLILGGLPPEKFERGWLAARRVRLSLPGHRPLFAAYAGYRRALEALRDKGSYAGIDAISGDDMARLSRAEFYNVAEASFMAPSDPEADK